MEVNYPSDCALALAIPLTRGRFLTDLAQPAERDLVFRFRNDRGLERADPEFCWQVYEAEEVALVAAVCETVAQRGVTVAHDVDLTQLSLLLAQFSIVTLVAHFHFVEFKIEDIEEPLAILDSLREPATELHREIRGRVIDLDPELLADSGDCVGSLRSRLCNVFRTIANQAEKLYWDADVQTSYDGETHFRTRLTRSELERAFPAFIKPALVIELSDGLHTTPELVKAIPKEFSGLLDLTVCNGVIPAAAIRDQRRTCLVAGSRKQVELRERMYLYGLKIDSLANKPRPFIDVIKEIHSRRDANENRGGTLWKLLGLLSRAMRRPTR